jgi:hypothetical protein
MTITSLDKVRMTVIKTAANGVVGNQTIFTFSQKENYVSASYAGGRIRQGYLVGYLDRAKLFFSYCQLQVDGKIDNGQSDCDLSLDENKKLILTENFTWSSRENDGGVNVFREI